MTGRNDGATSDETTGDDEFSAAVCVVTYERPDDLDELLSAILEQTRNPDELVVVDDSESDDSKQVVDDYRERLDQRTETNYIRRRDESGMQSARNRAIETVGTDVVCFLDDDSVPEPRWLQSLLEEYDEAEKVVGVGGPALKVDETLEPQVELLRAEENQNRVNEYGEVLDASGYWHPPESVEADVFRGANMSFRTNVLREIEGFDTEYDGPAIFEEWDVMTRAREHGSLVYCADAVVYHKESVSGGSRVTDVVGPYWFARNSIRFRRKHFRDTFARSLFRLGLGSPDDLPPLRTRLLKLFTGDIGQLPWFRGYVDGLRLEKPRASE